MTLQTTGWRNYIGATSTGRTFKPGKLYYGDGTSTSPTFTVTSLSTADNWIVGPAATLTKTYSAKQFRIAFYGCCRIAMSGPMSNQYWNVESNVNLNPTPGGWINTSPVSSGLPILDVYRNVVNSWIVPAADNDGDKLSYRLADKRETTTSTSRGGNPSGMTMSGTGLIQWKPTSNGLYGTQVVISDSYSTIAVDYILRVADSKGSQCGGGANSNPTFVSPSPWVDGTLPTCFKPSTTTTFTVRARDSVDTCDTIFIQSGSLPLDASFAKKSGTNPVDYTFSWNPAVSTAGNHLVCFVASDPVGGVSKQECITLYVPSSGSKVPSVSNVSPQSGETTGNTAITVKGSNFERGSGLFCRFSFGSVTAKELVQAVYVSTTEVVCVSPAKPSGATNALKLEVSNLASCDEWKEALNVASFYYQACPPGSTLSGPTCSECPAGSYQAGGSAGGEGCTKCPAGRYGDSIGLKSPLCTAACPAGYYCPSGTSRRDQYPCPAGSYGSTTGLTSSACSGPAAAGYYTVAGATSAQQLPCSAGRWGTSGQTASTCSGPCSAGYYCPSGSSSSTAVACGSASSFCAEGSSAPSTVQDGWYSVGGSGPTVRTAEQACDQGHYCASGVRTACPAGRFGSATGLTSSACSGPCKAGFFCPAGSTSSTAEQCDLDGSGNQYCAEGTSSRLTVTAGFYTTPLTALGSQRSGQQACEAEFVCVNGIRKRRVEWQTGCRALTDLETAAGGILGGAKLISKYSIDENGASGTVTLGSVKAVSNQGGSAATVSYEVVGQRNAPSGVCPSTGMVSVSAGTGGAMSVTVSGPLNFERCSRLEVQLRATAGSFSEDCALVIDVVDKNDSPKLTASSTSRTVREDAPINGLVGGPMLDVEVSDEDAGQELTFTISSSAFGVFKIGSCSGQLALSVSDALDFESRSSYALTVTISDGHPTDPKSVSIAVTVFVTDVNEPPQFLKLPQPAPAAIAAGAVLNSTIHFDFRITENSAAGTGLAADLSTAAYDPDTPTASSSNTLDFAILEQDPPIFAIDSSTGVLTVASTVGSGTPGTPRAVDFESLVGGAVNVRVRVRDSLGLSDEATFPIIVGDVNDAPVTPTSVNSSVLELAAAGTLVTDAIEARDEDRPPRSVNFTVAAERAWMRHSASWVDTASNASFGFQAIAGTASSVDVSVARVAVSAAAATSPAVDYERASVVELTLRATDAAHNGYPAISRDTLVTIRLRDVNERPRFVGVAGSAAHATAVAASRLPDGTAAYVAPPAAVATLSLSISELALRGTSLGAAVAFDPDVVARQSLFIAVDSAAAGATSGAGSTVFSVNTGGNITLVGDAVAAAAAAAAGTASALLDFETTASYTIPLRVTDSGSPSLAATATLVVTVIDEQEPPLIAADQSFTIAENSAAGTAVSGGVVRATDQDAADNVGSAGAGLRFAVVFNETGALTPGLLSNASAPMFEVDRVTGQLRLNRAAVIPADDHENSDLNHELFPQLFVTLRCTDSAGNTHTSDVLISVTDTNERPSPPGRGQVLAVEEQSVAGTVVGVLEGVDVDEGDAIAFVLGDTVPPTAAGATDACSPPASIFDLAPASATVQEGTVRLSSQAPFRPNGILDSTALGFGCNVTFTVRDRAGLDSPTGYLWVELVRDNKPPSYSALPATISLAEDTASGTVLLASLGASDTNADQTLTHSIRSVRPASMAPAIALQSVQPGAVTLRAGYAFDHETDPTINITVETRDDGLPTGLKVVSTIFLVIEDVPEAPVISLASGAVGSGMVVPENSPAGTVVGSVSATDVDAGETLRFTLSPPATSSVPSADIPFQVDAVSGVITVRAVAAGAAASGLSHEAAATWDVQLTVTDKDGLTDAVEFTIAVDDVNEPCTATVTPASAAFAVDATLPGGEAAATLGMTAQVAESQALGTVVARISATDPDDPEHPQGWGRLSYRVVPALDSAGEAAADAAAAAAPTSTPGSGERFRVSPTGEVSIAEKLSFHEQERHAVVVEILDGDASTPLGINITIQIRVLDDPVDMAVEALEGTVVHATAGGDDIYFVGHRLGLTARRMSRAAAGFDLAAPVFTFEASAVGEPGSRTYTTTVCAQAVAGDPTRVRCAAPEGYGTAWVWTLRWTAAYAADAGSERQLDGSVLVEGETTRTVTPVITSVLSGLRAEPTVGGSVLELQGTNFGAVGTPIGVTYGLGTGTEHTATDCVVSVAHSRARCVTVAGVGTGLGVIITVAGQASARFEPAAINGPLGYALPAVTALAVLDASADPQTARTALDAGAGTALIRTSGSGQQIVIQGTNLGANAADFVVAFGGGAGVASKYRLGTECSVVVSHTLFTCAAPSGQGQGLLLRVSVGGQDSPIAPDAPATTLSFAAPVVMSVDGQGARQGATNGEETLVIRGSNLPPVGDLPSPVVRFGPAPDGTLYTAHDCSATVTGSEIQCATTEGVGSGLGLWLAVDGIDPLAAWTGPGGAVALPAPSFPSAVSYHPPVVTGYEGPGAEGASTAGGAEWFVDVTGRNFGPIGHGAIDFVTYAKPAIASLQEPGVVFTATCNVVTAHTRLRCNISEGAGSDLAWNVTVGGQLSVEPVTAYDPPSILSFTGDAAPAAAAQPATGFESAAAVPDGNQSIVLVGKDFGPPGSSAEYLEWVRFAPAATANASASALRSGRSDMFYSASDCAVLSHRAIRCTMPPASGGPLFWTARVKGQTSKASPPFYIRRPKPLFLEPATFDGASAQAVPVVTGPGALTRATAGGDRVRVVGRWFGLNDPFAQVSVRWGTLTLSPLAMYKIAVPKSLVSVAAIGRASLWTPGSTPVPAEDTEVLDALEILAPEGFGQLLQVRVVVDSLAGETVSEPNDLLFSYAAPTLSFPSVREDTDNPLTMMFMLIRGSNLCRPSTPGYVMADGDPPLGSVSSFENCARVLVRNENDPNPALQTVFRTLLPADVVSHTHDQILVHVARGRGDLRVEVAGRATNEIRFEQLAPGFLTGECERFATYSFRSLGWTVEDPSQLLRVQAFDICNASLSVTIGGKQCSAVTFPPRLVRTDSTTGKRICEVSCRVPAGQGTSNEVIVVNGGMASNGAPGSPPCTVSYSAPNISAVYSRADARGDPLPAATTVTVDAVGRDPIVLQGARAVSAGGPAPLAGFVRPDQALSTPYAGSPADIVITLPTEGGRILLAGDSFGGRAFSDLASGTTVTLRPDGASRPSSADSPVILDAVPASAGGLGHNHTLVELAVPGVLTGSGWVLSVLVAGQPVAHYVGVQAQPPVVDSVGPQRTRTAGGELLTISGRNFGAYSSRLAVSVGGAACVNAVVSVPHREIRCVAPEGAGQVAAVVVMVDGISSGTQHGVHVSYLPPVATSISPGRISTDGRSVIVLQGDNFGRTSPEPGAGQAMAASVPALITFEPVSVRRGIDLVRALPDPDAGSPFAHGGQLLYHNHTHIILRAPQIQGADRILRIAVAGQSTLDSASDGVLGSPAELTVGIEPPLLQHVRPLLGPTAGYLVRFSGRSLGRVEPIRDPTAKFENKGLVVVAVAPGGVLRLPCSSVATAGGVWTREYAAWDFVDPVTGEKPPRPSTPYTHNEYFCKLPRGFGANITLDVSLDGIAASTDSAVSQYSYAPPLVRTLVPNQPAANGRRGAFLQGGNFGAASFGDATNDVRVGLSDVECANAELQSDERIECDTQRDVVGVKVLRLDAAGYAGLQFPVPERAAVGQDMWRVESVCSIDTYGQPGELCLDCPQGGVCEGSVCVVEAPPSEAASCIQFIEPYALPGFWKIAQPADLCPAERAARPAPFNGSCPAFLPCDPKDACLGSNLCALGYQGERCGECLAGKYYRRNGQCIQCPDNMWLLPILFAMLVIGVACGGYILHRLDTNIAGFGTALFVAVDHMQVLSILARSRVQWPPFLRDVLEFLSVFSFNIEVVGLECAVPDLGYETRWIATELLPVAFVAIFVMLHVALWLFKACVMRQNKQRRNDHVSSLISTSILLCYVLYLQVTRTAFDALNCMQLDPPDGYTYLEAVFTRCGEGLQARLAPLAYVFILLYTVGFVLFAGVLTQRNKEQVKIDQILRAMDVTTEANGLHEFRRRWSRLYMHFIPGQAPYWIMLLLLRKSLVAVAALVFGRVPSFQLAAIMLVLFVAFVLNVRYSPYMSFEKRQEVVLQHRAKARAGDELHKAIALTYQRAIADRRSQRRAHASGLDSMTASAASASERRARLMHAARWSGDPNRMETILLFVSMMVALTGILMAASDATDSASAAQRDVIAYASLVLLIVAILYAFGIVAFEIASTFVRGDSGAGCLAMCSCCVSCGKGKGKNGGKALGKDGSSPMRGKKGTKGLVVGKGGGVDLDSMLQEMEREASAKIAGKDEDADSGAIGFHVNPMAAAAMDVSNAGTELDSVLQSDVAPSLGQWTAVQKHADGLEGTLDKLRWEVAELKQKQQARAAGKALKKTTMARKSVIQHVTSVGSLSRRLLAPARDSLGDEDKPAVPSHAAVQAAAAAAIVAAVKAEATGDDTSLEAGGAAGGVDIGKVRRMSQAPKKMAAGRSRRRNGGGEKRPSIAVLAQSQARSGGDFSAAAGGAAGVMPLVLSEVEEGEDGEEDTGDPYAGEATCGPWTRVRDEEGDIWYINDLTSESQWEMPEGFDAPGAALWTPEMTVAAATNAAADAIVEAREEQEQADREQEEQEEEDGASGPLPSEPSRGLGRSAPPAPDRVAVVESPLRVAKAGTLRE